jgi:hypothetical protein
VPEWEYDNGASWEWPDDHAARWGDEPGFPTPEEAAAPEIPARYVRVVSVKYHSGGNHAVVELLTNEEPLLYPYTVFCERDASGRWHESGGHN